jgi:hypothetical protein
MTDSGLTAQQLRVTDTLSPGALARRRRNLTRFQPAPAHAFESLKFLSRNYGPGRVSESIKKGEYLNDRRSYHYHFCRQRQPVLIGSRGAWGRLPGFSYL